MIILSKWYALVIKKANKQALGKLLILQSIGIIVIKSKETRVIIYTCR